MAGVSALDTPPSGLFEVPSDAFLTSNPNIFLTQSGILSTIPKVAELIMFFTNISEILLKID